MHWVDVCVQQWKNAHPRPAPELCAVLSQNGPELRGPIFFGVFQVATDIGMDDFPVL